MVTFGSHKEKHIDWKMVMDATGTAWKARVISKSMNHEYLIWLTPEDTYSLTAVSYDKPYQRRESFTIRNLRDLSSAKKIAWLHAHR